MPPRSEPHPHAIFSLKPVNDKAFEVAHHQSSQHLLSFLEDGNIGLNVGHLSSPSGGGILTTLGRRGDILVEGATISRLQCSFEIDQVTNAVMFYDRSHSQTSAVFGRPAYPVYPFQQDWPRKVVVSPDFNPRIGMGGVDRDLVQFDLAWHKISAPRDQRAIHPENGNP